MTFQAGDDGLKSAGSLFRDMSQGSWFTGILPARVEE